jgi:hypothetical protein
MGIVLRFIARPQGQDTVGFFISLHSPIFPKPAAFARMAQLLDGLRRISGLARTREGT